MKKIIIIIGFMIGAITMLLTQSHCTAGAKSDRQQSITVASELQNNDLDFKTRTVSMQMSAAEYATNTWEFIFGGQNRTPEATIPTISVDLSHFRNRAENQLNVTWLGHSSLMINIDGYRILTDPVFEKRISILGPTRFNGEVPLQIDDVPNVDAIIISHDHYDHLNKFSVQHLHTKTERIFVPLGVGELIEKWGVPRQKIVELDWWQEFHFDDQLMLAATPAQHFSGRGLTDRNRTLWASWVVKTPLHRVFFSGDSGYFNGFKKIGETYGPFDMTFIECGAYNESWAQVHMFPEQTVQAHLDLKGNVLHPIHWGTFNLAMHPWYEPMERLSTSAQANKIEVALPMAGETTRYGECIPIAQWWQEAMSGVKINNS